MPAQKPIQGESNNAVSQQTESSNRPHLTKKERATGLIVDIADNFHDGPIKQAVNTPSLGTSLIFLPLALIFTFGAMMSGLITGGYFFQTKKLEYFGAKAQAIVVDQETVQKKEEKTEAGEVYNTTYDYWIVYRFQVLNWGRERRFFSKMEQVSKELHDQIKVDTSVPVVYDRNNPAVSRIKGNYAVFSPLDGEMFPLFSCKGVSGLFLILLIFISGGTTVICIIEGIVSSALLSIKAEMATAEIIKLEEFEGGNSMEYAMIYRFIPYGENTVITGRQKISKYIYSKYSQIKTIDVIYLARKPEWFKAKL